MLTPTFQGCGEECPVSSLQSAHTVLGIRKPPTREVFLPSFPFWPKSEGSTIHASSQSPAKVWALTCPTPYRHLVAGWVTAGLVAKFKVASGLPWEFSRQVPQALRRDVWKWGAAHRKAHLGILTQTGDAAGAACHSAHSADSALRTFCTLLLCDLDQNFPNEEIEAPGTLGAPRN